MSKALNFLEKSHQIPLIKISFWFIDNGLFVKFKKEEGIVYIGKKKSQNILYLASTNFINLHSASLIDNEDHYRNYVERKYFQTKIFFSEKHSLLFIGIRNPAGIKNISCYKMTSAGVLRISSYKFPLNIEKILDLEFISEDCYLVIPNKNILQIYSPLTRRLIGEVVTQEPIHWIHYECESKMIIFLNKEVQMVKYKKISPNKIQLMMVRSIRVSDILNDIVLYSWGNHFAVYGRLPGTIEQLGIILFKVQKDDSIQEIFTCKEGNYPIRELAIIPELKECIIYWGAGTKYLAKGIPFSKMSYIKQIKLEVVKYPYVLFSNLQFTKFVVCTNQNDFFLYYI